MALTAKQKEAVQYLKEELDKTKILRDRRNSGALPPAEVVGFDRELGYKLGTVNGYYACMIDTATEKQAEEIEKELKDYLALVEKDWK